MVQLATTLRLLAEQPYALVNGSLAAEAAAEVRADGGILTLADMAGYRVRPAPVLFSLVNGRRVASVGGAFGGAVLLQVRTSINQQHCLFLFFLLQALNTLSGLVGAGEGAAPGTAGFWHVVAEALKFAFANRLLLGGGRELVWFCSLLIFVGL